MQRSLRVVLQHVVLSPFLHQKTILLLLAESVDSECYYLLTYHPEF